MRSSTAIAPSNLALVKYWGKKDVSLRIPCNNSISMNLSNAKTTTNVRFVEGLQHDVVIVNSERLSSSSSVAARVSKHMDRIRAMAGVEERAIVTTDNSFPQSVGIASSASGFAALTVATAAALELDLDNRELSIISRLGSGSACRSIPDGFVEWLAGNSNETSFAVQIASPDHWDISIVTVVVSREAKKLISTDGHELATASPLFKCRLETVEKRLEVVRNAIQAKDFGSLGREVEMDAISMHAVAMSSPFIANAWNSGAYYWTADTMRLILAVQEWRAVGIETYFTLDAGPTVHLLCRREDEIRVAESVRALQFNDPQSHWDILINHPADGVRLVE